MQAITFPSKYTIYGACCSANRLGLGEIADIEAKNMFTNTPHAPGFSSIA